MCSFHLFVYERLCACMHVMKALFSPGRWSAASMTHCHFFSSHSISARALRVQSSPLSLSHPPLSPFSCLLTLPLSFFFLSISLWLFFSSTFNQSPSTFSLSLYFSLLCSLMPAWATAGLSVRIWIIEVYWVWSADGEMAVMDLSVLFRNAECMLTPVQLRRHSALLKRRAQQGSSAGHARKQLSSNCTCTCAHSYRQVQISHSSLGVKTSQG